MTGERPKAVSQIDCQGGHCVIRDGAIVASVELSIAGLLSDLRATEVAARTKAFKNVWHQAGCRLPYMGFNLHRLPASTT
jgi:adenine deaminase